MMSEYNEWDRRVSKAERAKMLEKQAWEDAVDKWNAQSFWKQLNSSPRDFYVKPKL